MYTDTNVYGTGSVKIWKTRSKILADVRIFFYCVRRDETVARVWNAAVSVSIRKQCVQLAACSEGSFRCVSVTHACSSGCTAAPTDVMSTERYVRRQTCQRLNSTDPPDLSVIRPASQHSRPGALLLQPAIASHLADVCWC